MPTVYQRAAARNDLVEHFVYLAENAGLNVAERFLSNAEASFNDLIFYILRQDGVSIVRVLHGAMDWWRLLGIDE